MPRYVVNYRPGEKDYDRPWGGWETTGVGHLAEDEGGFAYCDKILTVNPGCQLSIQKHEFRQEDWTITRGEAVVCLGDSPDALKEYDLRAGERIHIPRGAWHRIRNNGATAMSFAERQSGIYLDEKDNIRHPTPKDPRMTDEAAMRHIRAEVIRLGLEWPAG
ncbi:MAG: phosphomannose isomerase type II C-terminal cupin domain [Alphaproteobacteria bacterium]